MKSKEISFFKYQGTGNDFIILDQLTLQYDLDTEQVKFLCDRRFGVGGDGLMILRNCENADFKMVYFNSDGNESTMCGNGGRCISDLYFKITGKKEAVFEAIDGYHESRKFPDGNVSLHMTDVEEIKESDDHFVIDTGSPHFILPVDNVNIIDVKKQGSEIRYSPAFSKEGINVNFMEMGEDEIKVRTYERGVEGETLSCGTGVTACALASVLLLEKTKNSHSVNISTHGGKLNVKFHYMNGKYSNIWLTGPATLVYTGSIFI